MNFQRKNFVNSIYMYVFLLLGIFILVLINTFFFYINLKDRQNVVDADSDYTNLNLYFLKTTKIPGVKIKSYGLVDDDLQSYYITFENTDGTKNTFIKIKDIIYYNKIKLCENVESFKVIADKTGKESILVEISLKGKVYTSQYVIE